VCSRRAGWIFIRESSIALSGGVRPSVVRCSVSTWVGGRGSAAFHVGRLQEKDLLWCWLSVFFVYVNIGQIEGDRTRDDHGRLTPVHNERNSKLEAGVGRGSRTARLFCLCPVRRSQFGLRLSLSLFFIDFISHSLSSSRHGYPPAVSR
jgi:hypothetical protein